MVAYGILSNHCMWLQQKELMSIFDFVTDTHKVFCTISSFLDTFPHNDIFEALKSTAHTSTLL